MTLSRLLLGTAVACMAYVASSQDNPVLVGTVTEVTDGDTIKVDLSSGPITVRLGSIDAPESNQPAGRGAKAALEQLVLHREVALDVIEQDRYERLVAVVYLGEDDANGRLVEQGHAWAYRQYLADPEYCRLEHEARVALRGLWHAVQPVAPWEWRHKPESYTDYRDETVANCIAAKRRSPPSRSSSVQPVDQKPGECLIKGNVSDAGRVYHVPGSPSYDATKIDESKGEHWFCTEQEAREAGWRSPRN